MKVRVKERRRTLKVAQAESSAAWQCDKISLLSLVVVLLLSPPTTSTAFLRGDSIRYID